jgi:hypothetical protein
MITLDTGSTLPPPQRIEPSNQPFSFFTSSHPAAPFGMVKAQRPRNASLFTVAAPRLAVSTSAITKPRSELITRFEIVMGLPATFARYAAKYESDPYTA